MTNLSANIGNLKLNNCIYNASGPLCTSLSELINLNNSSAPCILTKSCTLENRVGNPEPRYYDNHLGSINSMGLPNQGIKYYITCAKNMTKPYIISVGGLNLNEISIILTNILVAIKLDEKIDGIEINLSCPNIIGKGQMAYDMRDLEYYLTTIFNISNYHSLPKNKKPIIGIKLPPYFDIHQFSNVCDIICKFPLDFITCVNSIGNGLIINHINETTFIRPKNGMGGIGGKYIKPTGLSNVRNFYLELKKRNSQIKIIGCGGIETGIDAFEYILCGATAVQIGTIFHKEGVGCFQQITNELIDIMNDKNYTNLEIFRGKLKVI